MYFGKEQEKQVLVYLQTRDEDLYHKKIHPLLKKIAYGMAGKMKMKPQSLYGSRTVKDGCTSLLWEKLISNYNPDKGRCYSYLTACAHNYYCGVWRIYHKSHKTFYKTHWEIEKIWHDSHIESVESFIINKEIEKERRGIVKEALMPPTRRHAYGHYAKVIEAVSELFEDTDYIEAFNKKAIYLHLRQLTGLKTKQIVNILDKIRHKYEIHKNFRNKISHI